MREEFLVLSVGGRKREGECVVNGNYYIPAACFQIMLCDEGHVLYRLYEYDRGCIASKELCIVRCFSWLHTKNGIYVIWKNI